MAFFARNLAAEVLDADDLRAPLEQVHLPRPIAVQGG
jgi:hypothetical protein